MPKNFLSEKKGFFIPKSFLILKISLLSKLHKDENINC